MQDPQFSRRTRFIITSAISLLAAAGGIIIAMLSHLPSPKPKLTPLTTNSTVYPSVIAAGGVVTITVSPMAPGEIIMPGVAVVIRNFTDDGTWQDESRGFTDAKGTFVLRFTTPANDRWNETKFTVDVSKDGYQIGSDEFSVWREK